MAIELGDGLQFEELLEILKRFDVARVLSPELRAQLLSGVDALLGIEPLLANMPPFIVSLLPLPPGWREKLSGAVMMARLVKGLLE